jgi:cytochrome c oxidase assembly protein subunit 15
MSDPVHELSSGPFAPRPAWYRGHVHTLALLTAIATFPLIFMGGLVTSHGAGLAVPDWPNSYGYNMFLFPPKFWIGGIFYEHTHRLMATAVGFLSILLCISAWIDESRRWVRWLATTVLIAVIFQGVLGGLRVVFKNLDLAIVHACVAQAFFCLAATVAVATSQWWHDAPDLSSLAGKTLFRTAAITVGMIFLQLMVGATMRHEQAGLAIPDFPLSYGHLLPPAPSAVDDSFRAAAMHDWPDPALSLLAHVTAAQIYLQFAHRVGAILVSVTIVTLAILIFRHPARPYLSGLAYTLLFLLAAQITLGILTVLLRKPADIASLHVAVGALTLLTAFLITLRSARLLLGYETASPAGSLASSPGLIAAPNYQTPSAAF